MSLPIPSWPANDSAGAISAIARARSWTLASDSPGRTATPEQAAARLGLEVEPVAIRRDELRGTLQSLGSSIIAAGEEIVAIAHTTSRHAHVLAPDGKVMRILINDLAERMNGAAGLPPLPDLSWIGAAMTERQRTRAHDAFVKLLGGETQLTGIWIVRPRTADTKGQFRELGMNQLAVAFVFAQISQVLLFVFAWWFLGQFAFRPVSTSGMLVPWSLIALSVIVARSLSSISGRSLAIRAGLILKRRLLAGALRLEPDEVHRSGIGAHLTHVLESTVLETTAFTGAYSAFAALVAGVAATLVLAAGAGGVWHAGLFVIWVVILGAMTVRYYQARRRWTDARFQLTGVLVENMVGHATRLVQRPPQSRTGREDARLALHLDTEVQLNRTALMLDLLRRSWSWVGLFGIAPVLLRTEVAPAPVAISIGGVLLGANALGTWVDSSAQLAGAMIVWRRVSAIWHAAARRAMPGSATAQTILETPLSDDVLLRAMGITFRYPDRPAAVLNNIELVIRSGERVLITGRSGSGKSTLATIISGGRQADAGLLLYRGLDQATVGLQEWQKRVILAPQFHANHVFIGTFAYNLLMGRGWPATDQDIEFAIRVARQVGLGDLLSRMPLGIHQPVGESGWRLSHGERSRLYLARLLLQEPSIAIVDETFGALDPAAVALSAQALFKHADAVLAVAHIQGRRGFAEGEDFHPPPATPIR